jgi:predicted Holliday junction resolvase-like endonuclease
MAASEMLLAFLLLLALCAFGVVLLRYVALKSDVSVQVQTQLAKWRESELHALRQQYHEIAQQEASVQLHHWRQELEKDIRKDAIDKSRAVTIGKVTEHVVPFFPGFHHNPKDARFIGTPVDFVVFDWMTARSARLRL